MAYKDKSQLPLDLFKPPSPTLENFFPGANSVALDVLRSVRDGKGPQIVYLYGQNGVGCTHLLEALARVEKEIPAFNESQRLYVVDNVEKLDAIGEAKLFDLINEIRAHPGTSLVAAGHFSPIELEQKGFRQDVTSRLRWGAVFEILPLTPEQTRAEFVKRVEQVGLHVSPEVLSWIEVYLPRDMHTLTNLLERATRMSLTTNRQLTIPLLKECLKDDSDVK